MTDGRQLAFVVGVVIVAVWSLVWFTGGVLAMFREHILRLRRTLAMIQYDQQAKQGGNVPDGLRLEAFRLELGYQPDNGAWMDRRLLGIQSSVLDGADEYCRDVAARALGDLITHFCRQLEPGRGNSNNHRRFVEDIRKVLAKHQR